MIGFRASTLVPDGLLAGSIVDTGGETIITVSSSRQMASCPSCGRHSARIHSRYLRSVADLPVSGRSVGLRLSARRFYCTEASCPRRVFTERFDGIAPWARRTRRLEQIVLHLGLALGGRPAAALAQRLRLDVSNDTLLRTIRRGTKPDMAPPRVVGIDDWAWRRNFRYGTIVCDLQRRRPLVLLPDRGPATVQAWLADQPQIEVIARDRAGNYALAANRALPNAIQVADRWHLMENASAAFLDAVRRSIRQIRSAIGTAIVDPAMLTAAEKLQYDAYLRREDANAAILALAKSGHAIKEIVRRTGHSRKLVRRVLRGERDDTFRSRQSSLEAHLPWLDAQWAQGKRNGAALWRQMRSAGFRGSLRVVSEWTTRRRRSEHAESALSRTPGVRTIARMMTVGRATLSKAETVTLAVIENGVPSLVAARDMVDDFQTMLRCKAQDALQPWIERARNSLIAGFANGIAKDKAAVLAAITSAWSNGQTEGQVTKLKLVKRQMYGRGKIDLLEARLIGAP